MKTEKFFFIILMILGFGAISAIVPDSDSILSPIMEQKFVPGKNFVWCGSFQLAWNLLPPKFAPDCETTQFLNQHRGDKISIAPKDYLAKIAKTENDLSVLNAELAKKFGADASTEIKEDLSNGHLIYACLRKTLAFTTDFADIREGIMFGGKRVRAFGIAAFRPEQNAAEGKQVSIFDCRSPDDFIIRLAVSTPDEVILARVPRQKTLAETVAAVEKRLSASRPEPLKHADKLFIPELSFDLDRDFPELERGDIDKAEQRVTFALNKHGAMVKSEARIVYKDGGNERTFSFNGPFLVCLKEKGETQPYLAVWVENAGIMAKIE
jgi:hypothetical protein